MAPSYELYDDEAWERGEAIFDSMKGKLYSKALYNEIARFVDKYRKGGKPKKFYPPTRGGFNFHYRIDYQKGPSIIIRFPIPGFFKMDEEKVRGEAAAMKYIAKNTTIPVPAVLHHGTAEESPGGIGPFIIMEYIEHVDNLANVLEKQGQPDEDESGLDPNIDEEKLEFVYGQIADILLQLLDCEFSKIGCLGTVDFGDNPCRLGVASRPLSFNLAQIGEVGGVPHFELPAVSKTYDNSTAFYTSAADMHLQQLSFQRNQAVESRNDCRKKYIAR